MKRDELRCAGLTAGALGRVLGSLACLSIVLGVAGCAALVGADFNDEYFEDDAGASPPVDSSIVKPPPGEDSGPITRPDSGPVVVPDGGGCPTGLTACSGLCVDLTSNPEYCGRCSTACPDDEEGAGVCVHSHCTFACNVGWVECAGGCCSTEADSGHPDDGGPPPNDEAGTTSEIVCSAQRCPIASNSFCCGGATQSDFCDTNVGDDCPVEMFCDKAAECGGNGVCCYDQPSAESYCATSCSQEQIQMCDPQMSGECQDGTQCTGIFTPAATSYATCQ